MTYSRFLQGGKKGGEFPRRLSATRVSLVSVAAVLPEVTPVRANVAAVVGNVTSVVSDVTPGVIDISPFAGPITIFRAHFAAVLVYVFSVPGRVSKVFFPVRLI